MYYICYKAKNAVFIYVFGYFTGKKSKKNVIKFWVKKTNFITSKRRFYLYNIKYVIYVIYFFKLYIVKKVMYIKIHVFIYVFNLCNFTCNKIFYI